MKETTISMDDQVKDDAKHLSEMENNAMHSTQLVTRRVPSHGSGSSTYGSGSSTYGSGSSTYGSGSSTYGSGSSAYGSGSSAYGSGSSTRGY